MGNGIPFGGFSDSERRKTEFIISDVDDTITSCGRLLPEALAALYLLRDAGKRIVLLTGGSAGWADVYARQWPVDAVIAESGALMISLENGEIVYRKNPAINDDSYSSKRNAFLSGIPQRILSSDQYARLYDVAVDKRRINDKQKEDIIRYAEGAGAFFSESSIHINIWFAPYDKWEGLKFFMSSLFSMDDEKIRERSIYLGDGLNDQPLFRQIPLSIGMNSIEKHRAEFTFLPRYITEADGGLGVMEVAESLIKK